MNMENIGFESSGLKDSDKRVNNGLEKFIFRTRNGKNSNAAMLIWLRTRIGSTSEDNNLAPQVGKTTIQFLAMLFHAARDIRKSSGPEHNDFHRLTNSLKT